MRVAVVGGTGMFGAPVARALRERGHEVLLLTRTPPARLPERTTHRRVDVAAAGVAELAEALDGAEVLFDSANTRSPKAAERVLVEGTRKLAAAAAESGVGHHVLASGVGIEHLPLRYYRAKLAQEAVLAGAPLPVTVVRATQLHELLDLVFRVFADRMRVVPALRVPLQPMAAADAGALLADVVEGGAGRGRVELAGPEVAFADELAQRWRAARGRRAPLLRLPLVGRSARALREGGLLGSHADHRGSTSFAQWLAP